MAAGDLLDQEMTVETAGRATVTGVVVAVRRSRTVVFTGTGEYRGVTFCVRDATGRETWTPVYADPNCPLNSATIKAD